MVGDAMEARSVDEYWTIVGYRDYWARESSSLNTRETILEDRIVTLQNAIDEMRAQGETLENIISGVVRIPSACGLWQGARAKENFMQCTEGNLHGIYKGTLDATVAAIRELEAALRDMNTQFEEVHASRMEADRNYVFWDQKVVYYW